MMVFLYVSMYRFIVGCYAAAAKSDKSVQGGIVLQAVLQEKKEKDNPLHASKQCSRS